MNKLTNGRVNIKSPNTSALFEMYDKIPANQCVTFRNATGGLWNDTPLSQAFFSRENIQILQNGIRAGVYKLSNGQYLIGPQDCDSLKIVMRSVFLQHSSNLPINIPQQISELNKIVLEYCIQQVYSEAQGYMKYVDDVSTLVVPIAHPVQATSNDRTIEFKKWF
jgi:hypothetical protein